jgi:uncharacterized protein (TIGR02646 family)
MRYINPHPVGENLPNGWAQRAQHAETAVAAAQPQARSAEVNANSAIWRDLKDTLKRASHNKCWYCESIDVRSDNAVDHFRPKNAVAECPGHEGYWWLAFRWDNYRFCCTYCNSRRVDHGGHGGGKADRFPLRVEAARAYNPAANLANEEPLLLDPCIPADPGLLWFDETGQAVPSPVCGNDGNEYPRQRATISIDVYHLNQPDLVDQRKVQCSEIRRRVQDADRYFGRYIAGDGTARGAFEDAVRDLRACLPASASYSSASRAMLMGLRGTHPIVDVILAAA